MIKLYQSMHLLMKIGLVADILSLITFLTRVIFDGPFIMIPIQLSLVGMATIFIGLGGLKMRQEYYNEDKQ